MVLLFFFLISVPHVHVLHVYKVVEKVKEVLCAEKDECTVI